MLALPAHTSIGRRAVVELFQGLFSLVCLGMFLEEVIICMRHYLDQEVMTEIHQEAQARHPMPEVCVATMEVELLERMNLTMEQYRQGGWGEVHYDDLTHGWHDIGANCL